MDYTLLEPLLMKSVRNVCGKIGFDESKVTWHIYRNWRPYDAFRIFPNRTINDYGYCCPDSKEVFIEEGVITNSLMCPTLTSKIFPESRKLINSVTLEDVILDEITHIQTGCDHGEQRYEEQFRRNRDLLNGNGAVISKIIR